MASGVWRENCLRKTNQNTMTCKYAHRRVSTLFTMVQATPAARVIDWPQPSQSDRRIRATAQADKSTREAVYANK
jgi:hypothetical protein